MIAQGATVEDVKNYVRAIIRTKFEFDPIYRRMKVGAAEETESPSLIADVFAHSNDAFFESGGFYYYATPLSKNSMVNIGVLDGKYLHFAFENPNDLATALDHERGHIIDGITNYFYPIILYKKTNCSPKQRELKEPITVTINSQQIKIKAFQFKYIGILFDYINMKSEVFAGEHEMKGDFMKGASTRYQNYAKDYLKNNKRQFELWEQILLNWK